MDKLTDENTTESEEAIQIVSLSKVEKKHDNGDKVFGFVGLILIGSVLVFSGIGVKEVFFKPRPERVVTTVATNSDLEDDFRERPPMKAVAPQYDNSSGDVSNTMMITLAKDAVKSRMSDPASARFEGVYVSKKLDNPVVCGRVNGKKPIGGVYRQTGFHI